MCTLVMFSSCQKSPHPQVYELKKYNFTLLLFLIKVVVHCLEKMVRLRHRYFVTEYSVTDGRDSAANNAAIRSSSVLEALTSSIRRLHGVHGVAVSKAGLLVKYINNSTQILFIRMRRSACSFVSSAIPFVRQVDGKSVTFRTLYTGATINHCNKFLVKYQRRILEEQYGSLKTDLQRQLFQRELENLKPYSVQLGST